MTLYRGWQMNLKNSLQDEVQTALQEYLRKHGKPPQILEVSTKLEQVELPEGMNVVVQAVRLPKNIILLGFEDVATTD